jgi:hypothetical protein
MKRIVLLIIIVLLCKLSITQIPQGFDYHIIVHNVSGEVVVKQAVSVKLSILFGNAYDTVVYSEKHSVITNQRGLASVAIGDGTDKTGNFSSIDWNADKYFLKMEIDATGEANYIDIGTIQILSVPDASSFGTSRKTSLEVVEDELFISRKYVGKFVDYRHTGPMEYNGPNIIWIKTSMDSIYGKISAYDKKCEFSVGDNLYIRRTYYSPGGISGSWVYQIENDSSIFYSVTDFQHDRKVLVETWFN